MRLCLYLSKEIKLFSKKYCCDSVLYNQTQLETINTEKYFSEIKLNFIQWKSDKIKRILKIATKMWRADFNCHDLSYDITRCKNLQKKSKTWTKARDLEGIFRNIWEWKIWLILGSDRVVILWLFCCKQWPNFKILSSSGFSGV